MPCVRIQRRELRAEAVDISAHGVCLTLPRALEVGTTCWLDLEIPALAPGGFFSVEARVCFCLQGKDGYRIGLNCDLEDLSGRRRWVSRIPRSPIRTSASTSSTSSSVAAISSSAACTRAE